MNPKPSLLRSLRAAWAGLRQLFGRERNARIELVIGLLALTACFVLKLGTAQRWLVFLCVAGVLSAEAMNSALEALADALHPRQAPGIGLAKDLGAAAVLIWVLASVVVGLWVFGPPLWMAL